MENLQHEALTIDLKGTITLSGGNNQLYVGMRMRNEHKRNVQKYM